MKFFSRAASFLCATIGLTLQMSQAQMPDAVVPEPTTNQVQTETTETPESVALRYTQAIKRKDWKSAAALMHPDALKQMKKMFRPLIVSMPNLGLGKTFFNVRTAAEFDRLSDAQTFERLMAAVTSLNPEFSSALATSSSQIIGHVLEGEDIAHVVHRTTAKVQGISVTKLGVMPLKRLGPHWRGLLSGEIEGLAAAFSQMAKSQPAPKSAVKKPTQKPPIKSPRK